MELHWSCVPFDALSAPALYEVLRLRAEVFVVEQACVYLDVDGHDPKLWHLLGRDAAGTLQVYARLVPPLSKSPDQALPMIGRVVTAPGARGAGQGRALMRQALSECHRLWPGQTVEISAQAHLERFYASLGFERCSAVYDDDGIPHIDMRRADA